jgi:hypothetical protein
MTILRECYIMLYRINLSRHYSKKLSFLSVKINFDAISLHGYLIWVKNSVSP